MTFSTALCIKPFSSSHSRRRRRRRHQQDDPSSPKVSCMGQVPRCKAAEKAAVPPLPPLPPPVHSGNRSFCFLVASVAFLVSPMNRGICAKKTKPALRGRRVVSVEEIEPPVPVAMKEIEPPVSVAVKEIKPLFTVALEEMDPPLPVVAVGKKEREMEKPALSLWKRRCRSRKLEELFFCRQEKLPAIVAIPA